jgi:hypothetical protein
MSALGGSAGSALWGRPGSKAAKGGGSVMSRESTVHHNVSKNKRNIDISKEYYYKTVNYASILDWSESHSWYKS